MNVAPLSMSLIEGMPLVGRSNNTVIPVHIRWLSTVYKCPALTRNAHGALKSAPEVSVSSVMPSWWWTVTYRLLPDDFEGRLAIY
jgi:hypothetical protein